MNAITYDISENAITYDIRYNYMSVYTVKYVPTMPQWGMEKRDGVDIL